MRKGKHNDRSVVTRDRGRIRGVIHSDDTSGRRGPGVRSSAQRQKEFRDRQAAAGLFYFQKWVPVEHVALIERLLEWMWDKPKEVIDKGVKCLMEMGHRK